MKFENEEIQTKINIPVRPLTTIPCGVGVYSDYVAAAAESTYEKVYKSNINENYRLATAEL